jgi:hypothetical protein
VWLVDTSTILHPPVPFYGKGGIMGPRRQPGYNSEGKYIHITIPGIKKTHTAHSLLFSSISYPYSFVLANNFG